MVNFKAISAVIAKLNLKKAMAFYMVAYCFFIMTCNYVYNPALAGEGDDYTAPVVSILNRGKFTISNEDVEAYGRFFPNWAKRIEAREFSNYADKDGNVLTWYFPTYAILCIPLFLMLKAFRLPLYNTFPCVNAALLMIALFTVWNCLKAGERKKSLLIAALSVNPIIFYIGWQSAEVCIYSFLVMGMLFWYNKAYKRAAFFISLAGTLNPVALAAGIIMTAEYALLLRRDGKMDSFSTFIKAAWRYAACYVVAIIPFIYNAYYSGHINLIASHKKYSHSEGESVIARFVSYLFDLNHGALPYFFCIFLLSLVLIILAVRSKHWRYLEWMLTFFVTVLLYSVMTHINSGMSGIARYSAWGVVPMLFAVCLYYDELIGKRELKILAASALSIGVILTGLIVIRYEPYSASKVSCLNMTPIAEAVLDKAPALYNPLHSTFNSRTMHIAGGYVYSTPIIYFSKDGTARKILATSDDIEELSASLSSISGYEKEFSKKLQKLTAKESYLSIPARYRVVRCNEYKLGETILFYGKQDENASQFVSRGFSYVEGWARWTDGYEAEMRLKTSSNADKLYAAINCDVYNQSQAVRILVNGECVYDDVYEGNGLRFSFANPGENTPIEILFELPDAFSPIALGQSVDDRLLGLSMKTMVISDNPSVMN